MDLLFEILVELIFDGSVEIAKSKKVSKWIRYPIILFLMLFILSIIALMGYISVLILLGDEPYSLYAGIALLTFEVILIVLGSFRVKKEIERLKSEK